jgi:hypothetical protein
MQAIVNRAKLLVRQPRKFFKGLKGEKGVRTAFRYLASIAAVYVAGSLLLGLLITFVLPGMLQSFNTMAQNARFVDVLSSLVLLYTQALVGSFVWSAILYCGVRLFGSKQPYAKTYQLVAYSSTPLLLFGWIPLVGLFALLYSLVLPFFGAKDVLKLSGVKFGIAYVMCGAVYVLLQLFIMVNVPVLLHAVSA